MTANTQNYYRPTLETLETREMMDAGIGGTVMHQMLAVSEGAQIRLLAQQTSALQNQNNPLSQSLTEANQTFLAQTQQLNANLQAADRIFTAWSHQVDPVLHNLRSQPGTTLDSQPAHWWEFSDQHAGQAARDLFENTIVAKGWNIWGIQSVQLAHVDSWDKDDGTSHLEVRLNLHTAGGDHILELDYDLLGTESGHLVVFKLTEFHGWSDFPFLEFAIRDRMGTLAYYEKPDTGFTQSAMPPSVADQATSTGLNGGMGQTNVAVSNAIASQEITRDPAIIDAYFSQLGQQAFGVL